MICLVVWVWFVVLFGCGFDGCYVVSDLLVVGLSMCLGILVIGVDFWLLRVLVLGRFVVIWFGGVWCALVVACFLFEFGVYL